MKTPETLKALDQLGQAVSKAIAAKRAIPKDAANRPELRKAAELKIVDAIAARNAAAAAATKGKSASSGWACGPAGKRYGVAQYYKG